MPCPPESTPWPDWPVRLTQYLLSQRNRSARVIGLDVNRGDLSIPDDDGVPLGPLAAEDGRRVAEAHVHGLGESACGVG